MPRQKRGGAETATLTLKNGDAPGGAPGGAAGAPPIGDATLGMLLPALMATAQSFVNKGKPKAPEVRRFFTTMNDLYAKANPEARGMLDKVGGETMDGFMAWTTQGMTQRAQNALSWANMAQNIAGGAAPTPRELAAYANMTAAQRKAAPMAAYKKEKAAELNKKTDELYEKSRTRPMTLQELFAPRTVKKAPEGFVRESPVYTDVSSYKPAPMLRDKEAGELKTAQEANKKEVAATEKAATDYTNLQANRGLGRGGRKKQTAADFAARAQAQNEMYAKAAKEKSDAAAAAKKAGYVSREEAMAMGQRAGLEDAGRATQAALLAPQGGAHHPRCACGGAMPSAEFMRKVLRKYDGRR